IVLEIPNGASEKSKKRGIIELGQIQRARKISDGSRDLDRGIRVSQPACAAFEEFAAHIDRHVLCGAPGVDHCVENYLRLDRAAGTELDQGARTKMLDYSTNIRL